MKLRLEISLEHAVAFLSDPYANDLAPLEIGDKPIASTDDCIAFRVRPYFAGGADITVSSECPPNDGEPVFKKVMNCESSLISVSDSRRFNYCMFPVEGKEVEIEIWNSLGAKDGVWIKLSPLVEY
jgi:hypothetical protein